MFYQEGLNYAYVSFKFYLSNSSPIPALLLRTIGIFDVLTFHVIINRARILSFTQLFRLF